MSARSPSSASSASSMQLAVQADQLENVSAPELCRQLLGHEQVMSVLQRQLEAGRLPGGILLHGPRGIGKATLAFEFARRVLERTGDEDPERVREQVAAGAHPNLFVMRRVARERSPGFYSGIRVDEVRGALQRLHQTRGRAGHRIVIVDSIDDCNANAANALLKTLEEPPAQTHMLLISHRPGQLLPTIRSRCQAHPMRPLSDPQVREILQFHGSGESSKRIDLAVSHAGGRPRRGLEMLGLPDSRILNDFSRWLEAPLKGGGEELLKIAETLANPKNSREAGFAREMVLDWIAREARQAATDPGEGRRRVASANELWEKANTLFEQTDSFNLDLRQSLTILLDEISAYAQTR